MPQFTAGESRTARVILSNPKNQLTSYTGKLYIGDNLVAESSFSLAAGEQKTISFSVVIPSTTGTFPVFLIIYTGNIAIAVLRASEDMIIVPPALNLVYSNPWHGGFTWQPSALYDLSTGNTIPVAGLKSSRNDNLIPYDGSYAIFNDVPVNKPLMLRVIELSSSLHDYYFWYLFTLPRLGTFTLNGTSQQISSPEAGTLSAPEMSKTSNRCNFTGTVIKTSGDTINGESEIFPNFPYSITLNMETATDVSGYNNWGKYFIGRAVEIHGNFPYESIPYYTSTGQLLYVVKHPLISAGNRISGVLSVNRLTTTSPYDLDLPYWYGSGVSKLS